MAAATLVLATSQASAAVLSGEVFDNGVAVPIPPASATTVATSGNGLLNFTAGDSFFTVVGSAFGVPIQTDPGFQANALEITTAALANAHTLRILITQTGLTSPATNFQVASTFNNLISATTSATVSAYIDAANQPFAETGLLASTTYTSTSGTQATSLVTTPHPTPFAETFEFSMSFAASTPAGSSLSTSEALTAVPEPTSAAVIGLGVAAAGLARRRCRAA